MVNAKKMEKLPEGWNSVKLEEVGDINMGQSPPSTEINEKEIGVPFLQGNAEFTNKYPVPQKWIKKPLKLSKKGDILISIRAPVGAINKADRPYCIGRGLAAISFKAIDEKFGWFGLIYWKHQLENLSQGSTFEAVSKNDLNNLLLLIPISLLEQRKIAEILETVDNSIEKTDKIIEKYKRIKQGLMQVLLTKGIVESDELGVMSYEAKNKSFELEGKKWEIR
ncbi:MAG: restriction endonuclease subunit S, partial [Kosmotoga sp.]|uniref:restriction endonuclease subunit S n=1 Tax=Kosmotoga sp. TaxID=1955248 RepID=UPI001D87874B